MSREKNRINGTIGLENALYQNKGMTRYDDAGKKVLSYKEVLANILKYSVPEYEGYSCEEIMTFIDTDSISNEVSVSPDSDTRIHGDNTEQSSVNDANLTFDILFRVIKPSQNKIHLHVDVELQGKYNPGYQLEKRGIYNLTRLISSQLDVINADTNYDKLEKSYCIFICVGNVPKYLWNTISYYEFVNTRNVGEVETKPEQFGLMELVIIRIGSEITDTVADIIQFLHGIFYDTEEVEEYIDFSQNEEFRKELGNMAITGEHLIEYGKEKEHFKTLEALELLKKERERAEEEKRRADKLQAQIDELKRRI